MSQDIQHDSASAGRPSSSKKPDKGSFTGNHSVTIDEKLRVMIPVPFKALLKSKYQAADGMIPLFVTVARHGRFRSVAVYPHAEWDRRVDSVDQIPVRSEDDEFDGVLHMLGFDMEMDDQGRIRLDKRLIEKARLRKYLVVVGNKDHIEIWDEARFDDYVEEVMNRKNSGQ